MKCVYFVLFYLLLLDLFLVQNLNCNLLGTLLNSNSTKTIRNGIFDLVKYKI